MSGVDSKVVTKQRRLFVLGAIAVVSGIVAVAACSFPEPQLVPDEGGTNPDAPGGDTSTDGSADTGGDSDPFADVVEPDAAPPIDATSEKPFVDAAGCFCDCDKDGFRRSDQDAAGCDASTTEFDCDDLDPRANPGSGFRKDQPTVDTRGDWNCDTFTNREIKRVNLKCSDLNGGLIGNNCTGAEGFTGDPGCAEEGTYVVCHSVNLACDVKENRVEKQGCK